MTSERECYVYLAPPGSTELVTAARFRWSPTSDRPARGRLVYGKRYLDRSDAVEIDPIELRLGTTVFETTRHQGIFGALRDAMPDYWGRRVIERNAGRTILDELDYLLLGADDRAGALAFGLHVVPPPPRKTWNRTLDLGRLQSAADALLADDADAPDDSASAQIEELLLLGTSMGGARPKVVVEDADALWIAKLSHPRDRWNQPRVERAMLMLARRCGIHVPDCRSVPIGDRDALLVRRFDRDRTPAGYRRHRMVSALTLLRTDSSATDRRRWSYLLLADELRRVSSTPREDLRELFARMCFNGAISNVDDHPRNHAVLAKDASWRLSPAYDLTPAPLVSIEHRDLAMSCGEHGRHAQRTNLLSGAARFLLEPSEASKIFDGIVETVRDEWHPIARSAGVSDGDCARIAPAFTYEGLFT